MQRTAKRLAGQSGFVRRPAKGTAASTSSQPQAVGFVGRYLRPLGLSACGWQEPGEVFSLIVASQWGALVEAVFLQGCVFLQLCSQRCRNVNEAVPIRIAPDMNQSAPGAGAPTGDFWKRSGQYEPRRVPAHGTPINGVVLKLEREGDPSCLPKKTTAYRPAAAS